MNDKQLKDFKYRISGNPVLWRHKADELKHAASIIHESIKKWFIEADKVNSNASEVIISQPLVSGVYNMLLGFSIENLFKGIILDKNPEYLNEGKLSNELKNHNLISLSKSADFKLTKEEEDLCKIAWKAMISSGRYPISLNSKDQEYMYHLCDNSVYESLYNKLRGKIHWHLDETK